MNPPSLPLSAHHVGVRCRVGGGSLTLHPMRRSAGLEGGSPSSHSTIAHHAGMVNVERETLTSTLCGGEDGLGVLFPLSYTVRQGTWCTVGGLKPFPPAWRTRGKGVRWESRSLWPPRHTLGGEDSSQHPVFYLFFYLYSFCRK